MRRRGYWKGLLAAVVAVLWLWGCGGSGAGPVDEIGYSYYISSAAVSQGSSATTDIDIIQDCSNSTKGLLTKATMALTLKSNANQQNDIWLYRVSITYDRLDYDGAANPKPTIAPVSYRQTALIPQQGGSVSQTVDLLTLLQIETYRNMLQANGGSLNDLSTFQVTVTAHMTITPDDPQDDYDATYSFTINLANYNDGSCSSSSSSST